MIYKITCSRNWSKPPKYNTHFKWQNKEIVLDYDYNSDYLKIFVDSKVWIGGDENNTDTLVNLLSGRMVNLDFENCKEGEELEIKDELDEYF